MQNPDKTIAVEKEAITQLKNINKKSLKQKCKNLAKKLMGRAADPKDMIFWPAGMLLLGLTEIRDDQLSASVRKESCIEAVEEYHALWTSRQGGRVRFVDDALAGFSLLRMYEITADGKYLDSAHRIFAFLKDTAKDSERSIIYNVSGRDDFILADGVGMTALFLSYYGSVLKGLDVEDEAREAFDLAALQLINFRKNGCDSRTHLPYHAYSLTKGKLGILGWGRAVGWILMGVAGCAMYLPEDHEHRQTIMEWAKELVETAISYQRSDGAIAWDLPCMEGHVDSSATGMIGWSIKKIGSVMTDGLVESEDVLDKLDKALLYLTESSGKVIDSLSPCEDLAVHRQVYGTNAWGQGAVLACLKAK